MSSPHHALAIETSNPSACPAEVGLGALGGEATAVERLSPARRHDDDLMPAIDRLCARAGVRPADLRAVVVSLGPGGYTGLRIAVTTARFIAEATGAPCIGVPTAEIAACAASRDGRPFAVALASKGEHAFVTPFDAHGAPTAEGRALDAEGVAALGLPRLIGDGFLPESIRRAASASGTTIEPLVLGASWLLRAAAGREAVDPAHLLPIYAREPEAVRLWRARGGKGK
ncbi:MAG TPA: tRNA (adenosine(37)-N6)-threonylcarbamoyltransferase complex dimerization subunit type 1 TsaB [Phycisphaerales bacterium]|nr:tRNA (adenosine(37)-N6)-threonylcarbamoyltransferase complex dimerization subunit type 1 TsaB [Phycisphaerales bacterium]